MPYPYIVTIQFPKSAGGKKVTFRKEPPPNLAPRRGFARHPDCYMPKPARVNLTF